MVDILKILIKMLDDANSLLPLGHNPQQQFVLIITDGCFMQKVPCSQL